MYAEKVYVFLYYNERSEFKPHFPYAMYSEMMLEYSSAGIAKSDSC